jgi:hypothetical protein
MRRPVWRIRRWLALTLGLLAIATLVATMDGRHSRRVLYVPEKLRSFSIFPCMEDELLDPRRCPGSIGEYVYPPRLGAFLGPGVYPILVVIDDALYIRIVRIEHEVIDAGMVNERHNVIAWFCEPTFVVRPRLMAAACAGISIAVLAYPVCAAVRRRWRGCCPACGYDLTGILSARCPECGQPVAAK